MKKTVIWILANLTALVILVFFEYYYLISNNITYTSEEILQWTVGLWGILLICFILFLGFIPIMNAEGLLKLLFLAVLATITLAAEIVLFINANENVGVQTILGAVNFTLLVLMVPVILFSSGKE